MSTKITQNLMPILFVIAIIMYLIAICILLYDARFKIDEFNLKIFLGATGGLIGLLGFLAERYEKIISIRVELQTDFYKQWKDLRKEIRKLKEKADKTEGEEKFTEYFQFLNHEYDMKHHLNPRILQFYKVYRKNEFQDDLPPKKWTL